MTKKDAPTATTYAPPVLPYTLSSGRPVAFTQPDLFDLASGNIELPNQAKLDVWGLLLRGGDDDPAQQLLSDEKYIRSLYYAAQLVTSPRVRLDDEDESAVVDRREWSLVDLLAAFRLLRYGVPATAARQELATGQDAALSSDGLSPESE